MMKLSGEEQMALIHVLESTVMEATGWTAGCMLMTGPPLVLDGLAM
jgi:hypothetical protein